LGENSIGTRRHSHDGHAQCQMDQMAADRSPRNLSETSEFIYSATHGRRGGSDGSSKPRSATLPGLPTCTSGISHACMRSSPAACGNRDAAEDVTAEVFHRALASLPRYEWRGVPFGAWLMRIAANAVADRAKRDAREVVNSDTLPDAGDRPDLDRFEARARLFEMVDALPADQRTVIVERFVEQRSIRDIAQRLEKTPGAVKQLQFRALQTLRTRMEDADA